MIEIDLNYLEENFEEVMRQVEQDNQSFLLRTPDGEGILIIPDKKNNKVVQTMEKQGLIKKFK